MRNGFVTLPSDVGKLQQKVPSQLKNEGIICSALPDIETLKQAEAVYFVISKLSMSSTLYQELVLAALASVARSNCWLLRLDDTIIPLGFSRLRSLPEWHQA
jgi:hypothetical protein